MKLREKIFKTLGLDLIEKLNWAYINIVYDTIDEEIEEMSFTSDVIDWFWKWITLDSYDRIKKYLDINEEEYNSLNEVVELLVKNINKLEIEDDIYWVIFYL